MKIAVGSDHRGYAVKKKIISTLTERNHEVVDLGTDSEESVDYPDIAAKVSEELVGGRADRGILICGTGVGMSIAANKFPGIRAAAVHDDITAELSRKHNDCNILCLSADLLGERLIGHILKIWMDTEFQEGRHARRLEKIKEFEKRWNHDP